MLSSREGKQSHTSTSWLINYQHLEGSSRASLVFALVRLRHLFSSQQKLFLRQFVWWFYKPPTADEAASRSTSKHQQHAMTYEERNVLTRTWRSDNQILEAVEKLGFACWMIFHHEEIFWFRLSLGSRQQEDEMCKTGSKRRSCKQAQGDNCKESESMWVRISCLPLESFLFEERKTFHKQRRAWRGKRERLRHWFLSWELFFPLEIDGLVPLISLFSLHPQF